MSGNRAFDRSGQRFGYQALEVQTSDKYEMLDKSQVNRS